MENRSGCPPTRAFNMFCVFLARRVLWVLTRQGRNSFVRDNCHLLAGTVLPEGVVVPPFTVVRMLRNSFFKRQV